MDAAPDTGAEAIRSMAPHHNPGSVVMPDLRDEVVRPSVRAIVADKIAALIVTGALRVDDVLPGERDLAAALCVSRETVRGGLLLLARRGIVAVSHGTRTRVVSAEVGALAQGVVAPGHLNAYGIEDVHAARMAVELPLVAAAARTMDAATLHILDVSLAAQVAAGDDPVRFLICDRAFHLAIYQAAPNAVLSDMVCALYGHMMEHRRAAMARPGAIARSLADHRAIVAALRARDAAATTAAFRTHLERIHATTRDLVAPARAVGPDPNRG